MRGEARGLAGRLGEALPGVARAYDAVRDRLRRARHRAGPTDAETSLADAAALEVRQLELSVRDLVDTLFSGEYHSVFRGQGLEFSHLREYMHGDDVRAIDWNVTARRGHPYIKQFMEERELTVMLVVDVSASKDFGTGPRANAELAMELAAVLALCATRNNDRVGLLLVSDEVEKFIPPGSGRRHALRLLMELHGFRPSGRGTKLGRGLDYLARVTRSRAVVFLISDFILEPEDLRDLREVGMGISLRHDLVPIHLLDPGAEELPELGMLALVDPETGKRMVVDAGDPRFRDAYAAAVLTSRREIAGLFRDCRVDSIEVDTRKSYVPALLDFFRRRERLLA
jgi:uncharacterized protein (DUF58 family)